MIIWKVPAIVIFNSAPRDRTRGICFWQMFYFNAYVCHIFSAEVNYNTMFNPVKRVNAVQQRTMMRSEKKINVRDPRIKPSLPRISDRGVSSYLVIFTSLIRRSLLHIHSCALVDIHNTLRYQCFFIRIFLYFTICLYRLQVCTQSCKGFVIDYCRY